jgi:hypothetical protein
MVKWCAEHFAVFSWLSAWTCGGLELCVLTAQGIVDVWNLLTAEKLVDVWTLLTAHEAVEVWTYCTTITEMSTRVISLE